jgi:hypothetical protein
MGRWFFRAADDEPKPPTEASDQSPNAFVGGPAESTAASPKVMAGHQAKIRDLLRLEFECAADTSLSKGNLVAAEALWNLAKTTHDVEVNVLHAYARLLDDINDSAVSSEELRRIGIDWFPKNAAEYIERLSSARQNARPLHSQRDQNRQVTPGGSPGCTGPIPWRTFDARSLVRLIRARSICR